MLKVLLAESAAIAELLSVLDQEVLAMKTCLFAELEPLAERKSSLLATIEMLDRQRMQAATAFNQRSDPEGAALAAAQMGKETAHAWDNLLVLAKRAKACNTRNAAIVYAQLEFTQSALDVLLESPHPFYAANGARMSAGSNRGGLRLSAG
ncbi:flagella synthesis protein FlgN [Variovorax ginsengisoli]|uniref:Flagellar biosynthesis/type III secretory pathway chaperone n=1 Tax=Variovorax ginsengisoli TaxID=363844 RepID=A0ABT9SDL1_9BURK|nr:flagellar protein FlgN [Variovorax ginsengisoli]MDP9902270.1 flagellar biosynthesis/type III secretory pathway chaperone [Variovorax ginsengisoli]